MSDGQEAVGHSVKAASAYVVLAQYRAEVSGVAVGAGENLWQHVGEVEARSAEAAIRKHAEKTAGTNARVFVAIPARSFQPVKVTPKTVTTLAIEATS